MTKQTSGLSMPMQHITCTLSSSHTRACSTFIKTTKIVLVFTWRASPTNLCPHVLLLDQVTFSTTEAFTQWMCDEEPFPRLVLFV